MRAARPWRSSSARAGYKVVLLEKGPRYTEADFTHDEISISRRNFFMPLPWDEPHLWRVGQTGKYSRTNHAWTANCVGGGTVHMSGFFYRLKPVDFRMKSMLGAPPGSTVVDWPIRYEDLLPYYEQVEEEIGVSGVVTDHPWAEPRRKPYPLPPLDEHPIAKEIDRAGKKIGVHPYPTARAIISRPYRGRAGCVYCSLCGSYGCEAGAKSSTQAALIPQALATGNVELRTRCMARSVEVSPDGRAKSVVYLDEAGVLAGAAGADRRRLLHRGGERAPAPQLALGALAERAGQRQRAGGEEPDVQRLRQVQGLVPHLQAQAELALARRSRALRPAQPLGPLRAARLDEAGDPEGRDDRLPVGAPRADQRRRSCWPRAARASSARSSRTRFRVFRDSKVLQFETYAEWLPTPGTSVTVDDSVMDRYGLPVAAITIDRHPADLPVTRYLIERGEDVLRAMEPDAVWRVTEAGETTILQHGTCRFGNDPATSVLDRDCRAHTVPNLYVVDGSFMPTSGGNPNTLTIMANAYRVADRLVQRVKSGKI